MKKNILIIGAGGHSKIVYDLIQNNGEYNEVEFLDDKLTNIQINKKRKKIFGKIDLLENQETKERFKYAFVAIGDSFHRTRIGKLLLKNGYLIPNLIHPTAYISGSAKLGIGNILLVNSVIQTDVVIDDFVIINNGATIDHDCILGEGVHICPGVNIAGNVKIKKKTFVGIGSNIINNINIDENVIIGAGSLVIKNIDKNLKVFGSPAEVRDIFY